MKYTIEFELPNNKTIEDELQGSYVAWSIWGYSGVAKAKPVEEPKKGKWVDIVEMDSGGYPFKVGLCCSVCGAPTLSDDNYCPHCGAKMEADE